MTATVPCKGCKRPIGEGSPYYARQVGPKCGGIIRTPRRNWATDTRALAPLPGAALETADDQLELFFIVVVSR